MKNMHGSTELEHMAELIVVRDGPDRVVVVKNKHGKSGQMSRREYGKVLRDAAKVVSCSNTAATISGPSAGRNTVGGLVGGTMEAKQ